ncbi:hypothetical protein BGX23_009513 [Mortierella sp. AD031]|nr:hypothetical protein BGX23_009513 [Mortierella sp. AD031]
MTIATATSHHELTLTVVCPCITKYPDTRSLTIGSIPGWGEGVWTLTLRRQPSTLGVRIEYRHPVCQNPQPFPRFQSVHVVSRSDFLDPIKTEKISWGFRPFNEFAEVDFPFDKTIVGDKYDFDVVLSTDLELARTASAPASTPISKQKVLMSLMLKDTTPVEICFTFTSHKTCSNISLWAHRFVLSQHDSFSRLIQGAKTTHSLGNMDMEKGDGDGECELGEENSINNFSTDDMNGMGTAVVAIGTGGSVDSVSRAMVIQVDKLSLATFCVMLYYMYTGESTPPRFVLSDTNRTTLARSDSMGKIGESVDWRPLDQDSPWKLKDVTWKDLRNAAVHFGLQYLQTIAENCLQSAK